MNELLITIFGVPAACLGVVVCVCVCLNMSVDSCLPMSCLALLRLATVKKSIRLREEALAKEQVKATSSQTSADKLRKILKEEKR